MFNAAASIARQQGRRGDLLKSWSPVAPHQLSQDPYKATEMNDLCAFVKTLPGGITKNEFQAIKAVLEGQTQERAAALNQDSDDSVKRTARRGMVKLLDLFRNTAAIWCLLAFSLPCVGGRSANPQLSSHFNSTVVLSRQNYISVPRREPVELASRQNSCIYLSRQNFATA
jgi:hypothetical protein